jgi:hypothetical protein
MRRALFFLVLCVVFSAAVTAQELVYDAPYQVCYDGFYAGFARAVFNGRETGVFFYWEGIAKQPDEGVFFRRLDEKGVPFGPQKAILLASDYRTGGSFYVQPIDAVWDGEAYILAVVVENDYREVLYLLRISRSGEVLKKRAVGHFDVGPYLIVDHNLILLGDRVFLFYTAREWADGHRSEIRLLQIDKSLNGPTIDTQLPAGDLRYPVITGVGHDEDKFLVIIGDIATYDFGYLLDTPDIRDVRFLQVDFNGNVVKQPYSAPCLSVGARADAAAPDKIFLGGVWNVTNPVYVGDGFVFIVSTEESSFFVDGGGSEKLPYTNQSVKIDADGNILSGPYNLGQGLGGFLQVAHGRLMGNHVAFSVFHFDYDVATAVLLGKKAGHIGNVAYGIFIDYYASLHPVFNDFSYTGIGNTVVFLGYQPESTWFHLSNPAIFSNQYTVPFSKPGFFYFKAGTTEPVKNHRLVNWSIVGGRNVTLTGPDFELKDLPPVWSYMVDTKGQKTKLTLSFTTEDGKTLSRKLRIKP